MTSKQQQEVRETIREQQHLYALASDLHDWRAALEIAQRLASLSAALLAAEREGQ